LTEIAAFTSPAKSTAPARARIRRPKISLILTSEISPPAPTCKRDPDGTVTAVAQAATR
jgi:hypothetical protein